MGDTRENRWSAGDFKRLMEMRETLTVREIAKELGRDVKAVSNALYNIKKRELEKQKALPYSDKPYDGEDLSPYVYDGSMSEEDFRAAQRDAEEAAIIGSEPEEGGKEALMSKQVGVEITVRTEIKSTESPFARAVGIMHRAMQILEKEKVVFTGGGHISPQAKVVRIGFELHGDRYTLQLVREAEKKKGSD